MMQFYWDIFFSGISLSSYPNISRWYDFCSSKEPIQTVNKKMATEEVKNVCVGGGGGIGVFFFLPPLWTCIKSTIVCFFEGFKGEAS